MNQRFSPAAGYIAAPAAAAAAQKNSGHSARFYPPYFYMAFSQCTLYASPYHTFRLFFVPQVTFSL